MCCCTDVPFLLLTGCFYGSLKVMQPRDQVQHEWSKHSIARSLIAARAVSNALHLNAASTLYLSLEAQSKDRASSDSDTNREAASCGYFGAMHAMSNRHSCNSKWTRYWYYHHVLRIKLPVHSSDSAGQLSCAGQQQMDPSNGWPPLSGLARCQGHSRVQRQC